MSDDVHTGYCYYCGMEFWEGDRVTIDGKDMCQTCAQAYNDGASSVLEEQT
jgi:hypothetical protein